MDQFKLKGNKAKCSYPITTIANISWYSWHDINPFFLLVIGLQWPDKIVSLTKWERKGWARICSTFTTNLLVTFRHHNLQFQLSNLASARVWTPSIVFLTQQEKKIFIFSCYNGAAILVSEGAKKTFFFGLIKKLTILKVKFEKFSHRMSKLRI